MRQSHFKTIVVLAGFVCVVLLAAWLWSHPDHPEAPKISRGPTNGIAAPPTPASVNPTLANKVSAAAKTLAAAPDAAGRKAALAALQAVLATGSTNEISAAIRRLLDSKLDAPTGLGFKVGKNGWLTEAPTLRTWLLDYLGQINPAAAAEYAKVILSSADSPDEWALALRELAVGDTSAEARTLLEKKTAELLNNQAWQQNPSVGYLEAFDTAVYLDSRDLVPPLTDLVREQDNPAVAHAAFLALDRMVINNPAALLTALAADPGLLQGRENTRADYFARANVQDPQQRQILESYLLNPQISPAELGQFAAIFPNANFMISPNLLTGNPTPDHAALAALDLASLQAIGQWLADPRFAGLQPQLQKMQQRLQQFVQQEQASGH